MNFDRAFEIVVASEGGDKITNDPRDPGGLTKWGICQRDHPGEDIAALTEVQAKAIYHDQYWMPCKCDALPWPLSCYVFDAAVNQGVGAATKMLQASLDTVQDGILGQNTLRLAGKATPWHMARFLAMRALRYQGTRNFDRFGQGWLTRTYLLAMEA